MINLVKHHPREVVSQIDPARLAAMELALKTTTASTSELIEVATAILNFISPQTSQLPADAVPPVLSEQSAEQPHAHSQ